MKRVVVRSILSRLIDWVGALGFGLGVGFAAYLLSTDLVAVLMLVAGTIVGRVIMSLVAAPIAKTNFVPVPIEIDGVTYAAANGQGARHVVIGDDADEADVLDLELNAQAPVDIPAVADALEEDEMLVLDDPLPAVQDNDRVVRLFAPDNHAPAALVARIEDYLVKTGQSTAEDLEKARDAQRNQPLPDASEALHSALANIRASLR